MIEAMACGTPVLAFPPGSVPEIVKDGISGYICQSLDVMVARVGDLNKLNPKNVHQYAQEYFSVRRWQTLMQNCTQSLQAKRLWDI